MLVDSLPVEVQKCAIHRGSACAKAEMTSLYRRDMIGMTEQQRIGCHSKGSLTPTERAARFEKNAL